MCSNCFKLNDDKTVHLAQLSATAANTSDRRFSEFDVVPLAVATPEIFIWGL